MRVESRSRAEEDVGNIERRWRANRQIAPDLFLDELEATIAALLRPPTLGAPARALPLHRVRRVLMRRTRSYIYYRVFRETLEVLAVWHASRDREPAV